MGYTTEFSGAFDIKGTMTRKFVEYINRFSGTRRMKRNVEKIKEIYPDWKALCFGEDLGVEGEYLAINSTCFGQEKEGSIVDYNKPPKTQPGLWCQWIIETNEDLSNKDISEFTGSLTWDGGEKFYDYVEWLKYLILNFFVPMGLELNGAVLAVGEGVNDATYIVVDRNKITTYDAMEDVTVDEIKSTHSDNRTVVNYVKEIEMSPSQIYEDFWHYDDY